VTAAETVLSRIGQREAGETYLMAAPFGLGVGVGVGYQRNSDFFRISIIGTY
jgi:hypothetical protein